MSDLAEGVQVQVYYKKNSAGTMTANTEADTSTIPGASGATILRRVSSSLALNKAQYQSNEILSSRQLRDHRHGSRSVSGGINGEFSPATYMDFVEASLRGTWTAKIVTSQTDFTSVAFDNTAGTATFVAGNPVTSGYQVGDIIRFTLLTVAAANNSTNFVVTAMSGSSNRVFTLSPKPATGSADTTFSMTNTKHVTAPLLPANQISRLFTFEHYYNDIDITELFTECRIGGFNVGLPATGLATFDFSVMGRDKAVRTASNAPYFTSPTSPTTTGIFAAVNGLIQVGGTSLGSITGLNVSVNLNPSTQAVVGQNFAPEIFLGKVLCTGQMTALLENEVLLNDFINETEVSLLMYLTTTNAVNSPAATIFLPRVKFTSAPVAVQGESGQIVTIGYQALEYVAGTAPGYPASTIQIADTEA